MAEKLAANYQNRTYFFVILKKEAAEISINMYGTIYFLIKTEEGWVNKFGNKMMLVQGLVDAVIEAAK